MYQKIVADLKMALQDEQGAIAHYTKLMEIAPSNWERTIILGIRRDEMAHAITLAAWLTRLTGQMHIVTEIAPPTISDFRTGVREAIKDETEAYAFYGDLANRSLCLISELYYGMKNIQKDEKYHRELLNMMK